MPRFASVVSFVVILLAALILLRPMFAQPEYSKKERVQCTVCHDGSWSSGKYTDAGKYYMDHHTFKGYKPPKPQDAK
jgi:hypothetical protein